MKRRNQTKDTRGNRDTIILIISVILGSLITFNINSIPIPEEVKKEMVNILDKITFSNILYYGGLVIVTISVISFIIKFKISGEIQYKPLIFMYLLSGVMIGLSVLV